MKKLAVDVNKSLKYKANGRLKPSDKKEVAALSEKRFVCPNCEELALVSVTSFGEVYKCEKCGADMMEVVD